LGCYYLTQLEPATKDKPHVFGSAAEARYAHDLGIVGLRERIKVRLPYKKPRVLKAAPAPSPAGPGGDGTPLLPAGDGADGAAATATVVDEMPSSTAMPSVVEEHAPED